MRYLMLNNLIQDIYKVRVKYTNEQGMIPHKIKIKNKYRIKYI